MKRKMKYLISAAAGSLVASEAYAQTQSGVTMYGVVDAGIEYVSHAGANGSGAAYRVKSGNSAASRWGLRGKEDLGGGLSAIFVLENGYSVDTGTATQGGRLFGRKAFVGIAGPWGQVTLGRQYNILGDTFVPLDTTRYATYSVLSHDQQFAGIADNVIKYTGDFGNLTVSAMYSAGYDSSIAGGSEVPGAPRVGQEIGAGVSHTIGKLGMALVYDQRRGTSVATAGDVERRYAAGLIYTSGPFIAVAGYRYLQGDLANSGLRSDLYWLGVNYAIQPNLTLRAGIYRTDRRASSDAATSYTLQAVYNFSKRTDVFLLGSYMDNRGRSKFGVANLTTAAPGVGQTGVIAGIRHIF